MADFIALRHPTSKVAKRNVYFYNGKLIAEGGVINVPLSKPQWITAAYLKGYNRTIDGSRILSTRQLAEEIVKAFSSTGPQLLYDIPALTKTPQTEHRVKAGKKATQDIIKA